MNSQPSLAFGAPGIAPRWTSSDKEGLGTAYNVACRVWFTVSHGILNEIYYGTIDRPQTRDLQFLFTDGQTFFHEEKRDLRHHSEYLEPGVLGVRMTSAAPDDSYRLTKEILCDPHQSCLLIRGRLDGDEQVLRRLQTFVLLAPHMDVGGADNTGWSDDVAGRNVLFASRGSTYLAMTADVPLPRTSCGFVGASNGWTDLHDNFRMDWQFQRAEKGNIALMAEMDLSRSREFLLAIGFGDSAHEAATELMNALSVPFEDHRRRFVSQWQRLRDVPPDIAAASGDDGCLLRNSHRVILTHEDKKNAGAFIASLSIPWGAAKGDEDLGGYHLVWVRDLTHAAEALLAMGDRVTPLRTLVYMACTQRDDGGFSQNFWIDGMPYFNGVQLDQVAFPVVLAWRLWKADGLAHFDPYAMVLRAARYLVDRGPATHQDRWEENAGYCASTLALTISALICAADFAESRGHRHTAEFLRESADYWEANLERWTVTGRGELLPGVPRHYIRLLPSTCEHSDGEEDPDTAEIAIANHPAGEGRFPTRNVVGTDFLELVRHGIRRATDPLVEDSLRVIDAVLKLDTPRGPCWRRYNHDGYGEHADGSAYNGVGIGRAWPLLTAQRGQHELAAGRDPMPCVRAMEAFQGCGGLISEQLWDARDIPARGLFFGRPSRSARPLLWAHAEYIKLLCSIRDGRCCTEIAPVAERYLHARGRKDLVVWKHQRQIRFAPRGGTLRVQAAAPFRLHWTDDDWRNAHDSDSSDSGIGLHHASLRVPPGPGRSVRFTFFWTAAGNWEGKDYVVEARP